MNNIFVYIENEGGKVADVCLELLTKGRELATTLGVKLEAVVLGEHLAGIETELAKYGADTVWVADDKIFAPFRTLPHTAVMCGLIEQEKPQIALFGATCNGRDFAPRVSSALYSGLTADCTQLVIGDHKDAKTGKDSSNSLEARVPFGDLDFVTYVMAVDPELKMNHYGKGKYLLRHAFQEDSYLPQEILWREKAAFSDAVGHSMVDYLKEYAESVYTDQEMETLSEKYTYARPFTKESLLYREIFEKYYPGQAEMIAGFWMPNKEWEGCDVNDPSARVLSNYGESGK